MIKNIIKKFIQKGNFVRGPVNLNDRVGGLHKIWGHIFTNHLYGDYVEFGVYHGESFLNSIKQYKIFMNWLEDQKHSNENWRRTVANNSPLNKKILFHGLDTFSGMPENNEENLVLFEDYSNKVIRPSKNELIKNKPSRSAKLRFATRSQNEFSFPSSLLKKFNKYLKIEGIHV